MEKIGGKSKRISSIEVVGRTVNEKFNPTFEHVTRLISLAGHGTNAVAAGRNNMNIDLAPELFIS